MMPQRSAGSERDLKQKYWAIRWDFLRMLLTNQFRWKEQDSIANNQEQEQIMGGTEEGPSIYLFIRLSLIWN